MGLRYTRGSDTGDGYTYEEGMHGRWIHAGKKYTRGRVVYGEKIHPAKGYIWERDIRRHMGEE